MHLVTIAFLTFLLLPKCNAKSYRDHLLIHGTPKTEPELGFYKELDVFYNVTFWRKPSLVNKSVEFSLSRVNFAELVRDTKDMNIEFLTVIRDLQSLFDNQTVTPYIRRRMDSFDWRNYYSVEDIYNWIRDLSELYPDELEIDTIGQSVQNRHILAVKVELEPKLLGRTTVMVEGGCHAREWISPAFVTYMLHTILTSKNSTNEELKNIARSHVWIFIPLLNPDGYSYSQTNDRLWRKNYRGSYGIDLNRNFGVGFGKHGASTTEKNSEEFCGEVPFSEPETSALATYIKDNSDNLQYYLSFHAFGQYIIIPYANEKTHLDNFYEVQKYAKNVAERSLQMHNIRYEVGTAYETVGYLASGTSSDWVKKSHNVPYVVTIELPDQGFYGFALPKHHILPTCQATMDSILPLFATKDPNLRMTYGYSGVERCRIFEPMFIVMYSCIYLGFVTNFCFL